MEELDVVDTAHHRNGVAGEGFTVRLVEDNSEDGQRFVVITFDSDPMRTAVLDIDLLADGVITFGENSFRGDSFAWSLGLTESGEKAARAFSIVE
jgi:hypothetical protein